MNSPTHETETAMTLRPGTLTIGVLMGGASGERPISLLTGQAVADALTGLGHCVRPTDVRPGDITRELVDGLDVAFLALHGAWGEDGGIQAELEALGACYTGSGPEASRIAMDKVAAKQRFSECGVPTPAFRVAVPGDDAAVAEAFSLLGPRLVAKPVAEGSSIGLGMADTAAQLAQAVRNVWAMGESALIERRVVGREFTVGVLGEEALPLIEIRTRSGSFAWKDKYESEETEYVFEHGLPAAVGARVVEAALGAHRALGCRDLSRVDVMLTAQDEPQVLEVNTIPGFTSHSLVPKAAARAGLSFGRLCERIVALARRRAAAP
jgi:D-alanine-D-alanine ligase